MSTGTSLANPSNAGKETIYVDVDDEITTIIDKVRSSSQKIVALVLPKRATMLQSVVNMKLLKRSAEDAKKHLVLITNEASLLSLAGGVGLYVAKNLQSKPEIPDGPAVNHSLDDTEEALSMEDEQPTTAELDASKPVGDLAAGNIPASAVEDTIDLDNSDESLSNMPASAAAGGGSSKKAKKAASSKGGKFKIPNFNRFRLLLVLGALGIIVLIGAWIICFNVLPKASILVKTNASNVPANVNITLNTAASAVNAANNVVPAQIQHTQKSYTAQAAATGQQDNGTKASGGVTMTAQECGTFTQPPDVPAGTGVSSNGLTFITQQDTSFTLKNIKNSCGNFVATGPTPVVAQNNGSQYNVGSGNFTVAGRSDVSASGGPTSGGTSNIVKVVQQSDIDGAKAQLASQNTDAIKQQLATALQTASLTAIQATFQTGTPNVTTSVPVGAQADNVTVSETVTYTMFGAKQQDLHQLVASVVDTKIDTSKQVILDDGLATATFTVQSQDAAKAVVALQDTAVAGPDLKADNLKPQVAGKKAVDAENIIKANPGVTDVNVSYSPFWVSAIPKNTSKITIVIEKPSQNAPGS